MSSSKISVDSKRFINAARNGQLMEVIELSSTLSNNVKVLSEALRESCERGHLDVVKWLGGHTAADINYRGWGTPLTAACFNDHLDIVKYLVEIYHADVNLPDYLGYTPLTCRCVSMSISMYMLREISDLDVNIADRNGNTALHYAVWHSKGHSSQLHEACGGRYSGKSANVTKVSRLVYVEEHEVNIQDNEGNTPLHYVCSNGRSDILEILMLAGADETITSDRRETPAQVAERERHGKLLKLLDRDSLWQVMLRRRSWYHTMIIVYAMLTIRSMIIISNRPGSI